jgi:poly(A) polymerase
VTGTEAARRLASSSMLARVGALCGAGETFLTGGSLRDRLLGLPTHDLDLVVDGDAAAFARALRDRFGGTVFPLGRHPRVTWRVAGGDLQFDVWAVQGNLKEDILRRDFTVNALFWRLPRGPFIDLVGGLDDLSAGRIRVVREVNLADDPLRVLRGLRLAATRPQLRLTRETELRLAENAARLRWAARERVLAELRLLLDGTAVARALLAGARLGILPAVAAGWSRVTDAKPLTALAVHLRDLGRGKGPIAEGARDVSLAVLAAPAAGLPAAWDRVAATTELTTLGLAPASALRLARTVAFGERLLPLLGGPAAPQRMLAVEAETLFPPALAWALARCRVRGRERRADAARLLRWWRTFRARAPLLSGEEVARVLGLPPDSRRAAAVRALRDAQARGEVRTRSQALRWLAANLDR